VSAILPATAEVHRGEGEKVIAEKRAQEKERREGKRKKKEVRGGLPAVSVFVLNAEPSLGAFANAKHVGLLEKGKGKELDAQEFKIRQGHET